MLKNLTVSTLLVLSLLAPVKADEPLPSGLKFNQHPIVWEATDRRDAAFISLQSLNKEGLTTTEIVGIVVRTEAGNFEVFGGRYEENRTFVVEAFLGYTHDVDSAPRLILEWLVGRKELG